MDTWYETLAGGLRRLSDGLAFTAEPGHESLLRERTALVVVDLEMSGPRTNLHEVLELGLVRAGLAAGFPEESSWGAKVKPRHIGNAVPGALKVVGYSPKAWREAVELEAAMGRLIDHSEGAILCGWGLGQDIAFLAESCRRVDRPWPFGDTVLDVQPIARAVLRDSGAVDRFNLGHVADRLGIGRMGEHSALADAYATYDVLVALLARVPAA